METHTHSCTHTYMHTQILSTYTCQWPWLYLFSLISFKWPIQTLLWPLLLIIEESSAQRWLRPLWCPLSVRQPTSEPTSPLPSLTATANSSPLRCTLQSSFQIESYIYQNTIISIFDLLLITGSRVYWWMEQQCSNKMLYVYSTYCAKYSERQHCCSSCD